MRIDLMPKSSYNSFNVRNKRRALISENLFRDSHSGDDSKLFADMVRNGTASGYRVA